MYSENLWEFSHKVCNGKLDDKPKKPTFSKEESDKYYKSTYSTAPTFDQTQLNWFPHLPTPIEPTEFDLSPVRPSDIKKILSGKK